MNPVSAILPATYPFGQDVAWVPNPDWIADSNLRAFMDRHGIATIDDLQARSVADVGWFWNAVFEDLRIRFDAPYSAVFDDSDGPEFPRWCVDGQMNITANCLDRWVDQGAGSRDALRWEGEDGSVQVLSYQELLDEVGRCANALRGLGIGHGDAVGLFMPMTPALVTAFLAVIRVGAVVLPLFSGYGPEAVATRLRDANARALFTADGFERRGRAVSLKPVADAALATCPTVEFVIVEKRLAANDTPMTAVRDFWWHDLVPQQPTDAAYERTSAEDVLMIIYTSGTTGRPKGAVHTHCGFPIKAAQDMAHAMDVKEGDVVYWMTDMGWMMGPWLVFGSLLLGSTMVLFDGAPDFPGPDRVWKLIDDHAVTHLGLSPVLIRALSVHGTDPVTAHDVSSLRASCSTGSPWDPEAWNWLFQHVLGGTKPILNYSGGTEISGGILCGNFFKPLTPGSFSGPVPGMDADVVDEQGNPVRGAVGELVIRAPWIGMTRGFWRDRERYLETYWKRFRGVWTHGDFAAIDSDGRWYILGRSDDTIKVAGKRLGPAEVEGILCSHPDVTEAAAVGVPHPIKGEEVVAFCVLRSGVAPDESLRKTLIGRVASQLGKPMRPKTILFTESLPKTRNAKVMRRVIRAVHLGLDPGDVSSLEDPATVDAIRQAT